MHNTFDAISKSTSNLHCWIYRDKRWTASWLLKSTGVSLIYILFLPYSSKPLPLLCCSRLIPLFVTLPLFPHIRFISSRAPVAHGNLMLFHDPVSKRATNQTTAGGSGSKMEDHVSLFTLLSLIYPLPTLVLLLLSCFLSTNPIKAGIIFPSVCATIQSGLVFGVNGLTVIWGQIGCN